MPDEEEGYKKDNALVTVDCLLIGELRRTGKGVEAELLLQKYHEIADKNKVQLKKEINRVRGQIWRKHNLEKSRASSKKYYHKIKDTHKDIIKKRRDEYRKKHQEYFEEYRKQYYEKNRERLRLDAIKRYYANKERKKDDTLQD